MARKGSQGIVRFVAQRRLGLRSWISAALQKAAFANCAFSSQPFLVQYSLERKAPP
jgi:hypothetical protein